MIYIRLFYEFFKAGLFAIGGGLATLPFLYDIGERTGWFTSQDVADMIAISESTPGPIGINMSTYVGYSTQGIPGAIVATLGIITPSIIIIIAIAGFLKKFKDNFYVKSVFYGFRPASAGLIAAAGFSVVLITLVNVPLFQQTGSFIDLFNLKSIAVAAVIFVLTNNIKQTKKLHPVVFIAGSAVVGILFRFAGV